MQALGQFTSYRLSIITWLMFIGCTVLFLLPEAAWGKLTVGSANVDFAGPTRLAWVVYGAVLLTWPLWLLQTWRSFVPELNRPERRALRVLLLLLLFSVYAVWLAGGRYLWPVLSAWFGSASSGARVWLGVDTLSLLLKVEITITIAVAVGLSKFRWVLLSGAFLGTLTLFLIIPPYLSAIALLFLVVLDSLWFSLSGLWKLVLLILPAAVAQSEMRQGIAPWGAIILTGLFLLQIPFVRIVTRWASEQPQPTGDEQEKDSLLRPIVENHVEPNTIVESPTTVDATQTMALEAETETAMPGMLAPPLIEPLDEVRQGSTSRPETNAAPAQPKPAFPRLPLDPQGAKDMFAHVEKSLQSTNQSVRCQAMSAIGEIGSQEHLGLLIPCLQPQGGRTTSERLAAVEALGRLGGESAVDTLLDLANDPDLAVRWRAEEVLDILLAGRTLPMRSRVIRTDNDPLVSVLS